MKRQTPDAPAHWTRTRLRHVVRLNPRKTEIEGMEPDQEISFLPMEAIGEDGSTRLDATRPLSEVQSGYSYFRDEDVILAKITPCFENGKGALVRGLHGGIGFGTTELIVARPLRDRLCSEFLQWIFQSPDFRNLGEGFMYGAGGQKRVPDDFVRDYRIALPPLTEQKSITSFLARETGKIDALVEKQWRLIDLLKEKRQAAIAHAVTKGLEPRAKLKATGNEWLGEVPEHWRVLPVRRITTEHRQGYYTSGGYVDEGVPLLRITDLQEGGCVDYTSCPRVADSEDLREFLLKEGDFVFARTGGAGTFGWIKQLQEPTAYASYLIRFRFSPAVLANFMRFYFEAPTFQRSLGQLIHGGVNQNVHAEDIKNQLLALPPMSEQVAIAAMLNTQTAAIDGLVQTAKTGIDLLLERRAALISAAVTGKIDVREATTGQEDAA